MTALTLIMPYYMNPEMLALHYRTWVEWNERERSQIEIVIVDDGSPQPAADVPRPDGLPKLSIYRVLEDRPWHQHAARNLGAHVAEGPWLLLTDMDHVLTREAASALIKRLPRLDPETAYFLNRLESTTLKPTLGKNKERKPHPNSFVMTKDLYWMVGGYDEDYCGIYGTDGLFKTRLFRRAKQGFLKHVPLIRYWRDVMADASTTTLERKEGRQPGDKAAAAARKAARGRSGQITTLDFPWERVC